MQYLLLPAYLLWLIFLATPSLISLFLIKIHPFRTLIYSSLLLIFLSINFLIIFFPNSLPLSSRLSFYNNQEISDPQLNLLNQKTQLESWLKKQPTHRDILLNLAKINQALDTQESQQQAQVYATQAQALDPND